MEKDKLKKQVHKLCKGYTKDKKIVSILAIKSFGYIKATFDKLGKDISAIQSLYINGRGDLIAVMTDKTEIVVDFPD